MQTSSPLPSDWKLPDALRKRLGREAGRQRAMESEGHLLLILHEPPGQDEIERRGVFFWREPSGAWHSSRHGAVPGAVGVHLDAYQSLLGQFDKREVEAMTAKDYFALIQEVAPLLRAARNQHAALQKARELCPDAAELIDFRDRAYQIERTAELLYNDSKNSLDFAIARRAEEQTAAAERQALAAHRLNVLAAFFFPIATLTALFGVNLRHGLEETPAPWGFVALLAIGLILGGLLQRFISR